MSPSVTRRRVLYIPGYDPFHPRRYRELYRKEGRAQAAISGYKLTQAAASRQGPFGWHVDSEMEGARVRADIEVLVWSDIVQASMSQTVRATYMQMVRTVWTYISTGALFRLMRLRKGPVIAALYPVAFLILQLLIACAVAYATFRAITWAAGGYAGLIAGVAGACFAGWQILEVFRRKDNRFFAYYLMHDYAFSARWRGANPPQLEARMDLFRARIAAALADDVQEVLVVGHSSGAHLAVSILADMIRAGQVQATAGKLAFLSLGQVVPMMSFLPNANRLRADLHLLSKSNDIFWVDVTAPGDGCAFALCDPVAVSGVAPADQTGPLVMSAAFTQTLSPARWAELRWRFFRLHFQYLCAFDAPRDYDYFRITAGPLTLAERYGCKSPSPSTIRSPVNRHTTMTDE